MIGADLPSGLTAADFKFADSNVKVMQVKRMDTGKLMLDIVAGANAANGPSKLSVNGVAGDLSLVIFDKLDGIKILPALGRARVSCGAAYPPHGVQFVARGMNYGADGKPDTADDLMLEPVAARWWLEEEKTRDNDDDLKYLQTSVLNGLYTPVTTYGPIESRFQRREGVGLIAIGASYTDGGQEFKARSLLGVTVPDFITHIK